MLLYSPAGVTDSDDDDDDLARRCLFKNERKIKKKKKASGTCSNLKARTHIAGSKNHNINEMKIYFLKITLVPIQMQCF